MFDMTIKIKLHSVEDIKNFINLTNTYGAKQEVRQGRYIVDAKSILGVMSLDLSKPCDFWCESFIPDLKQAVMAYAV